MKQITHTLFLIIIFFTSFISANELGNVSPEQLLALQMNNALIVDIRTEKEWKTTGVIPNSHTLQFFKTDGNFDTDSWISNLETLKSSPDQTIVLVCRSGNRSETIGKLLTQKLGMKNVYHLSSGISHWIKSKHETTKTCLPQSSC